MGFFKSIKKAVKKATKQVTKPFESVGKEIGRAGDSVARDTGRLGKKLDKEVRRQYGGWAGTILSGGTNVGLRIGMSNLEKGLGWIGEAITPEMPGLPEMPEAPTYGQVQQNVQGSANVDLGGSESRRRTSGAAKGSRKLKVPLGGL